MTYTFRKVGGFFAIHDLTSLLDTQSHRALYCTNMIIPQNSCIINDYRAVSTIIMHYQGEKSYVDAERRQRIQVKG
jgi:hypothetical protein